MARYKLKNDAYIVDQIVKGGTEVGDGTPFPIKDEPGDNLEPLDAEAKTLVKQAKARREAAKKTAGSTADAVRLRGAEESLEELERVNSRLTKQLAGASEEIDKLAKDLADAQTSLDKSVADLAEANAKIAALESAGAGSKPTTGKKTAD